MRENVTISYRGANYELGRGRQFYGIWPVGAPPQAPPLEWWPETTEGWYGAWARFTGIEAPGTVAPVTERAAPARPLAGRDDLVVQPGTAGLGGVVAAGLLGLGVLLGIAGLFPHYLGESLAHNAPDLVPHLIYLAAWAGSALLILLGGRRLLVGALLAAGTSIVTFGLYLSDLGTATSGGGHGAGLVLALLGWLLSAAGAVVAVRLRPPGAPARPGTRPAAVLTLVVGTLAALGAAAAFAPSWDRFTLHTAAGVAQTITEGDAFKYPGLVITGDVLVMIALVITAVAALTWRPARLGAVLLAGALVPMVAQAISAIVQIAQGATPAQFGISSAQASAAGLTISSGLTAAFWIYCIFLVGLIATCVWLLVQPRVPAGTLAGPPAGSAVFLPSVAPMTGPSAGGTDTLPAGPAATQPAGQLAAPPASAPPASAPPASAPPASAPPASASPASASPASAPPAGRTTGQADAVAESVPSAVGQGPSQL